MSPDGSSATPASGRCSGASPAANATGMLPPTRWVSASASTVTSWRTQWVRSRAAARLERVRAQRRALEPAVAGEDVEHRGAPVERRARRLDLEHGRAPAREDEPAVLRVPDVGHAHRRLRGLRRSPSAASATSSPFATADERRRREGGEREHRRGRHARRGARVSPSARRARPARRAGWPRPSPARPPAPASVAGQPAPSTSTSVAASGRRAATARPRTSANPKTAARITPRISACTRGSNGTFTS